MNANRLTHIYGIASLAVGGVGIFIGFKVGADWKEIALFASGWVTAIVISFHLNSSMKFHGDSSDKVINANKDLRKMEIDRDKWKNDFGLLIKDSNYEKNNLNREIHRLNELVSQRTMTLDFIASVKMPSSAILRKDEDNFKANV